MKETHIIDTHLITDLRQIIEQGRRQAYISINASMIQTYWNVGRRIVEEEQHGEVRAGYGEYIAKNVAKNLQAEYGNAFNYRNICYFRKFYLCFKDIEIVNARVHNLTWTHIRHLLRVDDEKARLWYMKEAFSQLWSTRELERNINSQYYYRLLANNSWYFRNALVRANYRNIKKMRTFYEFWCQYINRPPMAVDFQTTEDKAVIDIDSFALQKWSPLGDEINREALPALKQWKVTT